MKADEFLKQLYENTDEDYGILLPPTNAQIGLDILITHFLGENCYIISTNNEQANSEAIYQILMKYPNGEQEKQRRREKRRNFIKRIFKIK